jgi:hypothetical protein
MQGNHTNSGTNKNKYITIMMIIIIIYLILANEGNLGDIKIEKPIYG